MQRPPEARQRDFRQIASLIETIESKAPYGLRRSVEKDRKRDAEAPDAGSQPDWTDFDFFHGSFDEDIDLEALIPGRVQVGDEGPYYLSQRLLSDIWHPLPSLPEDCVGRLYFDIESRGGHGKPLFLIGAAYESDGVWYLWQALARNPDEERGTVAAFADLVRRFPRLVSFSGLKNDWPFLRMRWDHYGLKTPEPADHWDLFLPAQERYRGLLPNCRLVTLERFLCKRHREGDLPSGYIPLAYENYLDSGDGRLLSQAIYHNALDIATMLQLQPLFEAPAEPWTPPAHPPVIDGTASCISSDSGLAGGLT